jgi:hypothetical protein
VTTEIDSARELLNQAYMTLNTPTLRLRYDEKLQSERVSSDLLFIQRACLINSSEQPNHVSV